MKIKLGDIVESEFGIGKVLAITSKWIIHEDEQGDEMAVYIPENWIGVPVEGGEPESVLSEVEVGVCQK